MFSQDEDSDTPSVPEYHYIFLDCFMGILYSLYVICVAVTFTQAFGPVGDIYLL